MIDDLFGSSIKVETETAAGANSYLPFYIDLRCLVINLFLFPFVNIFFKK
ncbi:MAG TPA: hypothetical protein VHB70_10090 [Parafilimonas sp.]|nr:hypothetical protein [Parafilimonas sp.]